MEYDEVCNLENDPEVTFFQAILRTYLLCISIPGYCDDIGQRGHYSARFWVLPGEYNRDDPVLS